MALLTTIDEKLRQSSRELLDLTSRNRLINTPRTSSRSTCVEVVDADPGEVFDRLVCERKSMTFAAGREGKAEVPEVEDLEDSPHHLEQPEEVVDKPVADSQAPRRADSLQTRLTSEVLQRRLLGLYSDARTYQEEQGVNILFLAAR